ncbi:hypothetical protein Tco_0801165 [Tanacetum coccineum]|uniref:Uncharacterized protein n=1 Tax=Tanacetum coccineum TaxID=301880 RepID=A0ABQ4ZZA5_9ASTR
MFTQEEQYTELLEPIPEPHQVQQNDSNDISEVPSVEQGGGIVEHHLSSLRFNSIKDSKSLLSEVLDQTFDRLQKLISQLEIHGESISQEDVNQKFLRSEGGGGMRLSRGGWPENGGVRSDGSGVNMVMVAAAVMVVAGMTAAAGGYEVEGGDVDDGGVVVVRGMVMVMRVVLWWAAVGRQPEERAARGGE